MGLGATASDCCAARRLIRWQPSQPDGVTSPGLKRPKRHLHQSLASIQSLLRSYDRPDHRRKRVGHDEIFCGIGMNVIAVPGPGA